MQLSVVYEDQHLLVINKPAGLIVHPKNATDQQPSVTAWLIERYPELANVGEPFIASGTPVPRTGVVHRLDKDTSGLLLVAKTNDAFLYLKNLFQTRKIKKSYLALVYGHPKESAGVIDAPLGRIGMKRTTRINEEKLQDKKEAVTEYRTLRSFKEYAFLEVSPKTGRTHQIRVHLKSIGCPIVGDPVYAPKDWPLPSELTRLFLHAQKLSFTTPDGKALTLEADLPDDLADVLAHLD